MDREAFARVMGFFSDKIGRPLLPPTYDLYFETLSESLTTEEFLAGARIVFKTHQFNTWPAPQQFVDAVRPPTAHGLDAAELFEKCLRIVGHHGMVNAVKAKAEIDALGEPVARAFRAAGGFRDFVNVLETQVAFLRQRFVEAYEAATVAEDQKARAIAALDRGALDPRVQGLVRSVADHRVIGRDRALPAGDR